LGATAGTEFQGELPQRGVKSHAVYTKNLQFSREIAAYLGNRKRECRGH